MTTKTLYPYQVTAAAKIVDTKSLLVAFEQGLGKTPLTITALEQLMDAENITNTVLVVVLSSLKYQWVDELKDWAPHSSAVVVGGTPKQRQKIYADIESGAEVYDYVIVNYGLVVKDYEFFGSLRWGAVVCDEVSAIKNFRSKRSKALKSLARHAPVRIGLTGTPMANGKPEEIFSIMEFVYPRVLGRFDTFDSKFIKRNQRGWPVGHRNLPELHRRLEPVMVRKRQADPDVRPYLPKVYDMPPTQVAFDRATNHLYRVIAQNTLDLLAEAAERYGNSWSFNVAAHYGREGERVQEDPEELAMRGEIMSRVQAMRMLCSHPQTLLVSAAKYRARLAAMAADGSLPAGGGSEYAYVLKESGLLKPSMKSPKLEAVVQRIKDHLSIDDANKVVLFSTFRDVIPLLDEALSAYSPQQFHGGMNDKAKERAKKTFQTDPACRVLISSDAGGYGVNLPQANLLINYDLPWTSADALQRNSRIIRASSEWASVRIERYLMLGSLEQRQWEALRHKETLSDAVIDGGETDEHGDVFTSVSSLTEALSDALDTVSP